MTIRNPYRAGSFYDASPDDCRHHAEGLIDQATVPDTLPSVLFGGIVPHAGWVYSGRVAATTFKALAARGEVAAFVLFGADHFGTVDQGEVFYRGTWRTPVGDLEVDEELAKAILASSPALRANPQAHQREHSLEVQLPIIKLLCSQARIVPIAVPPTALALDVGKAVGGVLSGRPDVYAVGSTDLTHHGGHFPAPGGRGATGAKWTAANDRRMIDLMEAMSAEKIVPEADARSNACGAGAIAATVAACRTMGATRGLCLSYTNSYEIVHAGYPADPDDTTVGYASVVFA
ncbi:MAG: AmmeMemoRadiSam system protein B [Phycisphaerae bacterium]|nr:AmmeMemoRadiSam system protein B [Phycisphaerae bacterium]